MNFSLWDSRKIKAGVNALDKTDLEDLQTDMNLLN